MLILLTLVPHYLHHSSLSSPASTSLTFRITPDQTPPPDTLLVPLYPLLIRRFFVRSRSIHVYIYIDSQASSLPFLSCIRPTFPLPPLNISSFFIRNSCVISVAAGACAPLQVPSVEYFLLFNFHVRIITFSSVQQLSFLAAILSCFPSITQSRSLRGPAGPSFPC